MENLKIKCDEDCWNCQLEGCPYTLDESSILDKEIEFENKLLTDSEKGVYKSRMLYRQTESYKESAKRYNKSKKGREAIKRWYSKEENRIKNNEKAKKYYREHREEILEKQRQKRIMKQRGEAV